MIPATLLFVGGGSLGHVLPGVAVYEALRHLSPDTQALFICAPREEERAYLQSHTLHSTTVNAGKFPRGVSLRWISFPALFTLSFLQSIRIVRRTQPIAVFTTGGFVSVPVCLAAWLCRIPIVAHESDSTSGLANTLIATMAKKICVGFPSEKDGPHTSRSQGKTVQTIFTGNPVRPEIRSGSFDAGRRLTGFSGKRMVIMITGGSQGSVALNQAVTQQIDALLEIGDVIHLTGKGKSTAIRHAHYWAAESVSEDLPHLYALANIVITRGGAGTLSELAALKKAAIVVPLCGVAGNHQWHNAQCLAAESAIILLAQDNLSDMHTIVQSLAKDPVKRSLLADRLHAFFPQDSASKIAQTVLDVMRGIE